MRVCEYTVVSEINDVVKELDKVIYTSNAKTFEPDYTSDYSDNYEGDHDQSDDYCGGNCSCENDYDSEESEFDDEYHAGYEAGKADVEDGYQFQQNLDSDASDAFARGYADGFNNNELP
jgi:hypothetical protein